MTNRSADRVVIVDYKMGNVASVQKVFRKIGAPALISHASEDIEKASHIVLPGVGAFGAGMENLRRTGLIDILKNKVVRERTPFLGICLGMQLLADSGHEYGTHAGLGWVRGEVVKLNASQLRLPHVGWNDITMTKGDVLLENLPDRNFYFVHSYHLICANQTIVTSTCEYGDRFVASIRDGNIFGTQFHPEKSQLSGLQLLKNFLHYA